MPEIPLSDGPRSGRILPIGIAVETLAAPRPAAQTLARARELAEAVHRGERDEALLELVRHSGSLVERPPALELVLEAVMDELLPDADDVAKYSGRLLYCLRVQEAPTPSKLSSSHRRELAEGARGALCDSLRNGAETVDEAVFGGLSRGVLEIIWAEATDAVLALGAGWLHDVWLTPHRYDYVFQQASIELEMPSRSTILEAISSYPSLIDGDGDKMQLLYVQMVKHHVLPQLLARRWPEAVVAAEQLMQDDRMFQTLQDFFDITSEARRLLDAQAAASSESRVEQSA
jgi:hypothetical protein